MHWFEPLDGDSGPFGLIGGGSGSGPKRPSYTAVQQLIEHLGREPTYVGWTLLEARHYAFVFGGPNGPVMVAWTSGNTPANGSPIEIAAVVVWRVSDTAKALFDVEDYGQFVSIQSESAVRELASSYVYDNAADGEHTLRASSDEIARALQQELQSRLRKAGVVVEEARLSHLAYAPEIAQVMLRRQQAEAIVAARSQIVHGAVSMVDMALQELSARRIVDVQGDRRAQLVSNLLVVLCSESETQPVISTSA